MSKTEFLQLLKENDLLVVSRKELLDLVAAERLHAQLDKRVKWLTAKQVILKYGVSKYWLRKTEVLPGSVLVVRYGEAINSTKKYQEQSVVDELQRQSNIN